LLGWSVAAVGLACLAFVTAYWISHDVGWTPTDAHNYILAGLRLNVGHALYGYGPGDERVVLTDPGTDYPIYSPPLLAVLFRLIVLLPSNGLYAWWVATDVFEILAILALVRRANLAAGLALIPLSLSVGCVMEYGNVDCFLMGGLLLAWYWMLHGHQARAAIMISVFASLKLTPVIFVWWLIVTGRKRAAAVSISAGAVLALVTMAATEPDIFLKFAQVTSANLAMAYGLMTPSNVARSLGVSAAIAAWLPRLILAGGAGLMWLLRKRPAAAWAVAALLMWLGSPVADLQTPALALVALAPLAWPLGPRLGSPTQDGDSPAFQAPAERGGTAAGLGAAS
jgi:alpha-1,2-mannosyltransferase